MSFKLWKAINLLTGADTLLVRISEGSPRDNTLQAVGTRSVEAVRPATRFTLNAGAHSTTATRVPHAATGTGVLADRLALGRRTHALQSGHYAGQRRRGRRRNGRHRRRHEQRSHARPRHHGRSPFMFPQRTPGATTPTRPERSAPTPSSS